MATVIGKVATVSRQMANDCVKVATVLANLATVPAQMATHTQVLEVIRKKAVIKCMGRDGNNGKFFSRDENAVKIV